MRQGWTAAVAAMVTLAVVPDGQAATVSIAHQGQGYGLNWTLWVVAQPGERNEIVVSYGATGIRVTDSVPLSAGDHCALQLDGSVSCQPLPGSRESSLHGRAGDLDDTVRFDTPSTSSTYLVGGPGDDVLSGGGVHADFTGGSGDDTMTGGPGHDLFHEGRAANGSDAMTEGPGADRYDRSRVLYSARARPVHADLAGDADDGEPGERDRIGADIDSVVGGSGSDTLVGNAAANDLAGHGGRDLLIGGAGDDRLRGNRYAWDRFGDGDRLYGGAGDDALDAGGGSDLLAGGPGKDELRGASGDDRLLPGRGRDVARSGPGNDVLRTRDGLAEIVVCGAGADRLLADPFDYVTPSCERR
jgi:Ca2+-binding RTX toxin-like protein